MLTELVLAHRVQPEPSEAPDAKTTKLVVVDASPAGEAVLDEALRRIGQCTPARADSLLPHLSKGLKDELVTRLVAAGAPKRREERVWKIFPRTKLHAVDPSAEPFVHDRVTSALRGGRAKDECTADLVALLSVSGTLAKVVDPAQVGMVSVPLTGRGSANATATGPRADRPRGLPGARSTVLV